MIKVLGADGSHSDKHKATSFLIDKNIVIDAGNIIESMGKECCKLEHIFITHTHFDHIKDLPFIIESYFECREKPLKIYALKENIETLQQYLFNWSIWPDFVQIVHKGDKTQSSLQLIPIEYDETVYIDNIQITPIFSNHTTPTCGFQIKKNNQSFVLTGDTYLNGKLIERINLDKSISTLLIDVSFSSEQDKLALETKHLTPQLLQEMLSSLERTDVAIYTYHQKPIYVEKIDEELTDLNLLKNGGKRLETGDIVDLFTPLKRRKKVKSMEFHYDNENHFKELFNILQKIQMETDLDKQFSIIIDKTMKLTHADLAALCLYNHEKKELEYHMYFNETLTIQNENIKDMKPNQKILYQLDKCDTDYIMIDDIYNENTYDFNWIKQFDRKQGYHSCSTILVPILNCKNEIIGMMQLINKKNIHGENIPFEKFDCDVAKTLLYQASNRIEALTI